MGARKESEASLGLVCARRRRRWCVNDLNEKNQNPDRMSVESTNNTPGPNHHPSHAAVSPTSAMIQPTTICPEAAQAGSPERHHCE